MIPCLLQAPRVCGTRLSLSPVKWRDFCGPLHSQRQVLAQVDEEALRVCKYPAEIHISSFLLPPSCIPSFHFSLPTSILQDSSATGPLLGPAEARGLRWSICWRLVGEAGAITPHLPSPGSITIWPLQRCFQGEGGKRRRHPWGLARWEAGSRGWSLRVE